MSLSVDQYCDANENVKKAKGLGNVHTVLDRICVGMNTILDRAFCNRERSCVCL